MCTTVAGCPLKYLIKASWLSHSPPFNHLTLSHLQHGGRTLTTTPHTPVRYIVGVFDTRALITVSTHAFRVNDTSEVSDVRPWLNVHHLMRVWLSWPYLSSHTPVIASGDNTGTGTDTAKLQVWVHVQVCMVSRVTPEPVLVTVLVTVLWCSVRCPVSGLSPPRLSPSLLVTTRTLLTWGHDHLRTGRRCKEPLRCAITGYLTWYPSVGFNIVTETDGCHRDWQVSPWLTWNVVSTGEWGRPLYRCFDKDVEMER